MPDPAYRLRSVYERVLRTGLEVQVVADTRARAGEAEGAALDEIDRLTGILNRFDPASELRRWREAKGGASHPGADAFIDTRTEKYTVNVEAQGAVAVLNDLHRGWDAGGVWAWLIDLSGVFLTVVSLTGLDILLYLKKTRVRALAAMLSAGVLVALLARPALR